MLERKIATMCCNFLFFYKKYVDTIKNVIYTNHEIN